MDFELTDEQLMLKEATRGVFARLAPMERVREVAASEERYDPQLWRAAADNGWLAILLPQSRGGLGLDFVDLAVVAESVGRFVVPSPILSTALAVGALAESGASAAERWVEGMAEGRIRGCVGVVGQLVVDAPSADVALLAGAGSVTLSELGQARPPAEPVMDITRSVCWLSRADGETVLGGEELQSLVLDQGAVAYAAEMLGTSERVLELSTAYAKAREQFGRQIGSFQAIKHRLADMLVDVEAMRSAAYYAAWAIATGAPDRSLAASSAKAWCSDASRHVMDSALQIHGGIGFTWEHDLHIYLKRAHLDQILFGDATFHRARVAEILRQRVTTGSSLW